MSDHSDVPEWVPERPADSGGPGAPRMFLGASDAGGGRPPRPGMSPGGSPGASAPPPIVPGPRPGHGSHAAPPGHGGHGGRHSGGTKPPSPPRGRRRTILLGPMAAAVVLTVLVGLGIYTLAGRGGCGGDGAITLNVAAAPDLAPAVTEAAERLNGARRKAGGKCVRAVVTATDPAAVSTLLSGRGVAGVTRRPDVWIPDSSLWIGPAESDAKGGASGAHLVRRGSLATSPLVVAVPRTLAAQLKAQGPAPSWGDLLKAASPTEDAGTSGQGPLPPGELKLQVPDPNRSAVGMGTLLLANQLLGGDGAGQTTFTGLVRTIREGITPSVQAEFTSFRKDRQGRYPIALAPEQAVYAYNARTPAEPAIALYPSEGTFMLDHPYLRVGLDGDKAGASGLFETAMNDKATQDEVRRLGFRSPDGAAPASFGTATGVTAKLPRALPLPTPAQVQQTLQAWARLSLSIRMLSVIDVSASMEDTVAPDTTRLQSTIRTAQGGLSLLPDDTELGQWIFSTKLEGGQDWRQLVSVGPLGERLGSTTRRQLVLSAFAQMRPKPHGDTGLYDTILAAFKEMKRTYKPEFVNSILLWTDGKNDDPGGPSLEATLAALRREYDPDRPVMVFMFGYGKGVDVSELRRIADATHGDTMVANTPAEVQKFFLQAVSRRVCAPNC